MSQDLSDIEDFVPEKPKISEYRHRDVDFLINPEKHDLLLRFISANGNVSTDPLLERKQRQGLIKYLVTDLIINSGLVQGFNFVYDDPECIKSAPKNLSIFSYKPTAIRENMTREQIIACLKSASNLSDRRAAIEELIKLFYNARFGNFSYKDLLDINRYRIEGKLVDGVQLVNQIGIGFEELQEERSKKYGQMRVRETLFYLQRWYEAQDQLKERFSFVSETLERLNQELPIKDMLDLELYKFRQRALA